MSDSVAPAEAGRIPKRAFFIIGNEACERLSYYGMSAVLTLFLRNEFKMEADRVISVSHLFKGAVYLLPLFGAILADRWLGRYRTILYLSVFYCFGHLALAMFEDSPTGFYIGLGLIALGAGGIKPCVSAFMGDQFATQDKAGITRAYAMFYWAINFGSFFGLALIPMVRDKWGYSWAFGIPGIFMGLALLIFFAGSRTYTKVPPAGKKPGYLAVVTHCLLSGDKSKPFWERARGRFDDELVDGSGRVTGVIGLFCVLPVFWALFDQTGTTWVLQGEKMSEIVFPLPLIGEWKLTAESIQALNPVMVMTLIPIMTLVVYPLATRLGLNPKPLRRMTLGMVLAALSFVACAVIEQRLQAGAQLSILWQAIPYVLLTAGEVLFSTTGLEFAFTQAPKIMKSTLTSYWLLAIAAGNLVVAGFAEKLGKNFDAMDKFLIFAGLMLVVSVIFGFLGRRYSRRHET